MTSKKIIIISPVRNEEDHIEETIKSIVSQSVIPIEWIIVSDGSTDSTDEIVSKYSFKYDFIKHFRLDSDSKRTFASKVKAFNFGCKQISFSDYEFIGNLDGDVTFEPNYFESILNKFEQDSKLGIAGGAVYEFINDRLLPRKTSSNSVPGAVQLFRRQCYEMVGGYTPLEFGGIDTVAEVTARMLGWKVRKFSEIKVIHHGKVGFSETKNSFGRYIRWGKMHYLLGYHPVYYIIRAFYRFDQKPYLLSSILSLYGFFTYWIIRKRRPLPNEFINFFQSEQLNKISLKNIVSKNSSS